jgi:uncharacterized SAM-binding protein YcdF (DUF218 family)
MFFFFSKVLFFIICPLNWVLALLISAIIVKKIRLKQRFLVAASALLLFFSTPYILQLFVSAWDTPTAPLKPGVYSCAIVLGGFVSEDAKKNVFFNSSSDRFLQAVRLFNTGKVSHILISGGNGTLNPDSFREANWVKAQLQQFKVPDSCILIENQSRNTIENAAFSKVVLQNSHLQPPYLLITSSFHMRRSLGIFKNENIDVVPYTTNRLVGRPDFSIIQFFPDAEVFSKWVFYIKEVVGVMVNKLR